MDSLNKSREQRRILSAHLESAEERTRIAREFMTSMDSH